MPKRKVTSAPWVPVPARAYTGKAPRARQHRAVGRLSAGAPRLHKSCRWRRPQSKGRSCRSGRARRDLRVRGGRGHLSERPGWPSGSPISRGSTVSMIAFGGRRGPHRSGSRCRGRPIERREAGREGCLWPNAASQGRPPDGSGGESERSTQNGRAKTLCGGGGGGGAHTNSELPQAGFPESGEVFFNLCRNQRYLGKYKSQSAEGYPMHAGARTVAINLADAPPPAPPAAYPPAAFRRRAPALAGSAQCRYHRGADCRAAASRRRLSPRPSARWAGGRPGAAPRPRRRAARGRCPCRWSRRRGGGRAARCAAGRSGGCDRRPG